MSNQEVFNIAIDGPAGAGKSTIAKKVANALEFIYVDTGATYRAMGLYMSRNGLSKELYERDPEDFNEKVLALYKDVDISIEYRDGEQVVLLNGENVNPYIRTSQIGDMASICSAVPEVRKKLVARQKEIAATRNSVMDGRDIGTVVLPDAQVKIYLTASVEVRAKRRVYDYALKGKTLSLKEVEDEVRERDHRDMTREASPLKQADDAVVVDSSDMTIDQVVETIMNLVAVKKNSVQVITAKSAGFCFGVQRAVDAVYEEAEKGGRIFTYGPIIHNEEVVEDLRRRGVEVINTLEELEGKQDATIVLRSHGVPKDIQKVIESKCAKCVDTTCTFVKRIHEIVEKESAEGKKIVIIGNHGHAEAEGTMGWSASPATIIETRQEALQFDEDRSVPLCIVAQTTFNGDKFSELVDILCKRGYNTYVMNTICNATHVRQSEARDIAKGVDAMIVIGGKSSSNTAKLYEICKEQCDRTYFIQTAADLKADMFGNERVIGITAGASTPKNIIEEVQKDVRRTNF